MITHFFFIPRLMIGWSTFWIVVVYACLLSLGHDPFNLPEWRAKSIRRACTIAAQCICYDMNIFPKQVRVKADYSKYLGKDYEKTYDGAGIQVQNHLSPFESLICWGFRSPQASMLGKREGEKIPGGKQLVGPMGHVLTSRDVRDSKEDRDKTMKQITEKQMKAERGETLPLLIFPEGATTNGRSLLQFKRGAFTNERAVKPYYSKYKSMTGVSPCAGDATSFIGVMMLTLHCLHIDYTIYEMPVFKPNEYFWKHHWD